MTNYTTPQLHLNNHQISPLERGKPIPLNQHFNLTLLINTPPPPYRLLHQALEHQPFTSFVQPLSPSRNKLNLST